MAVTEDPESTRNSTEWSPIQPSNNQCPVPKICMTGSSYRNGSSYLDDVTAGCTSCEKSVPVNSSPSQTGNCSVSSSTGGDSVIVDPLLICIGIRSVSSSTGGDSVFVDPLLICIGIRSVNSPPVALI